mmetsp:Transcript_68668/g.199211  ORF Transcript_68668/g.199211 Transcript_68668/m.199211 type:complete len:130 (+) Transcript_68668:122-511(+)|eukprot:CAMPEP_0176075350 /NCGR_PEP_ID=MMETSP0120_2-20121206/37661_1 /TAXON_ID=160619 /ORGANISM="Kryptoperidinium foliaceum, Strain CCMP 1326" /LENGTH=129 /DNA_ID=CAMNT_0017409055 /DNA_START=122 /DNA_END=511 /DNA_ORIENTATION=-
MACPCLLRTTRVALAAALLVGMILCIPADALSSGMTHRTSIREMKMPLTRVVRNMGLYDDPLPANPSGNEGEDDSKGTSSKKELDEFREKLKKQEQKRKRDEYFSGKPDADWLPIQNPKPLDDEPWFTG